MKFHDLANIFPLLHDDDLNELVEDIRKNGQLEPIATYEDQILDGRNRYRACLLAKVEPDYEEVAPEDPVAYVVAKNLHRRHLQKSQLAMIEDKIRDACDQQAKERQKRKPKSVQENLPEQTPGQARDQVGKLLGVSGKLVDQARRVRREGSRELAKAVEDGEVTVNAAVNVLGLPKGEQLAAAKNKKRRKPKPPPPLNGKRPTTISEHAIAARHEIAAGSKGPAAAVKHGFKSTATYKRAAQVASHGAPDLIAAMDGGLMTVGEACKLIDADAKALAQAIEQAELKKAQKRHKTISAKNNSPYELLCKLLEATWVDWRGLAVPISRRTLPRAEKKRGDFLKKCRDVRRVVNETLDRIEKEME